MIFVTGCARSGTSLITQLLQVNGCYLGPENRVNSLFENVSIRENVLKPYLIQCNADPLGQDVLPDTDNLPPPPHGGLRKPIMNYLERAPRAYKDAKLTLVYPAFHAEFPLARWVLVRRDREKIIDSCMRTLFMRKRLSRAAWSDWIDEHERRFVKMRQELSLIEVWTDKIVNAPEMFSEVAEFCGLAFRPDAIRPAIDHKRWHG